MAYYGSISNVAALALTWTENGEFTDGDIYGDGASIPSLTQVETWMTQMSGVIDLALNGEGFITPLTTVAGLAGAASQVEGVVADLCHAAHKSGRFFTKKAMESGTSPIRTVNAELNTWVSSNKVGLLAAGERTTTSSIGKTSAFMDTI
jgi:hypothetical protein